MVIYFYTSAGLYIKVSPIDVPSVLTGIINVRKNVPTIYPRYSIYFSDQLWVSEIIQKLPAQIS